MYSQTLKNIYDVDFTRTSGTNNIECILYVGSLAYHDLMNLCLTHGVITLYLIFICYRERT